MFVKKKELKVEEPEPISGVIHRKVDIPVTRSDGKKLKLPAEMIIDPEWVERKHKLR